MSLRTYALSLASSPSVVPVHMAVRRIRHRSADIHNTDRVIIIDGKEVTMSQDEILDNVIRNHPEALNDFVQLNLEYIIDGSEVRRKTVEELQDSLTKTNDAILISYIEKQIEKQIEVRA